MRNRLKILICSLIGCSMVLVAQDAPLPVYHNLSVMPHTGQLAYSVDLFRIKDVDFDWSIGLTYTSDGFRPLTYSGIVGEGWTLQAGGSITREIIGIADDMDIKETYNSPSQRGYLSILRDSLYSSLTNDILFGQTKSSDGHINSILTNSTTRDLQSDIYTFAFCGYEGSFMINPDLTVSIISGDYVEIDISNITLQNSCISNTHNYQCDKFSGQTLLNQPQPSTISIRTIDGYTYMFGGGADALGYTIDVANRGASTIIQWPLSQIVAPNGRTINLHYSPTTITNAFRHYEYHSSVGIDYFDLTKTLSPFQPPFNTDTLDLKPYAAEKGDRNKGYAMYANDPILNKVCILDSITTSDNSFSVTFSYMPFPNQIYTGDQWLATKVYQCYWSASKEFLQYIRFRSSGMVSDWDMTYHQLNLGETSREYLSAIKHRSGVQYRFDYDFSKAQSIINPADVDSIDIAGYRISTPSLGVLSKIHDPLGNTTNITYRLCQYDSIRILRCTDKFVESSMQSYPYNHTKRILYAISLSSISQTNKDGVLLSKRGYEYGFNIVMDNRNKATLPTDSMLLRNSSYTGILNIDFAIDISQIPSKRKYLVFPYVKFTGNSIPILEYSSVTERIYKSDGENILYSNHYHYDTTNDIICTNRFDYRLDTEHLLGAYRLLSQYRRRNHIIEKREMKANTIKRKIDKVYTPLAVSNYNQCNDTSIHTTPWGVGRYGGMAYKIFIDRSYLTSEQITEYETMGNIESVYTYQKDDKMRLKYKTIKQGNTIQFSQYTYPDELLAGVTSLPKNLYIWGLEALKNQCRIAKPMEILQGFISTEGEKYITNATIDLYKYYNYYRPIRPTIQTAVPEQESIWDKMPYSAPCATLKLTLANPIVESEYNRLLIQEGNLQIDSRYDTVATYTYDRMLRLTSVTPIGRPTTYYSWDARRLYITTETTGAFSKRYTYLPYIGLSSETDIRGITTYYQYDLLGNLVEVYQYDDNGKKVVLKAYQYHYATQDE